MSARQPSRRDRDQPFRETVPRTALPAFLDASLRRHESDASDRSRRAPLTCRSPTCGPSLVGVDLEVLRFDEEHGIFVAGPDLDLPVGSWLRMVPGYAPATVNMYDCYYVVDDDRVIDVWPVFPRGPGHNGLIELPLQPSGRA